MATAAPLSRLERLPPELLSNVLDLLVDDQCDRSQVYWFYDCPQELCDTLLSLCLVSKTINAASTPYLYHSFRLEFYAGYSSEKLVRTLASRPSLADHIRVLDLTASNEVSPVSEEALQHCRSALWPLSGTPIYGTMVYALSRGCETAQALLILLLARNVRCLRIFEVDYRRRWEDMFGAEGMADRVPGFTTFARKPSCKHCPDLYDALRHIFGTPCRGSGFNRLVKLHMTATCDEFTIPATPMAKVSHLFELPAIKRLELEGVHSTQVDLFDDNAEFVSNVSRLSITNTDIDHLDIITILNKCQDLNEFEIASAAQEDTPEGSALTYWQVRPTMFIAALELHQDSLASLKLHNVRDCGQAYTAPQPTNIDLRPFRALKWLEVDERVISPAGFETLDTDHFDLNAVLPESLSRLTVHVHSPEPMDEIMPNILKPLWTWQSDLERTFIFTFNLGGASGNQNEDWFHEVASAEQPIKVGRFAIMDNTGAWPVNRLCFYGHLDSDGDLGAELLGYLEQDGDGARIMREMLEEDRAATRFAEEHGYDVDAQGFYERNVYSLDDYSLYHMKICTLILQEQDEESVEGIDDGYKVVSAHEEVAGESGNDEESQNDSEEEEREIEAEAEGKGDTDANDVHEMVAGPEMRDVDGGAPDAMED